MKPEGSFTYFVLRPLSDLVLWLWRLERRLEFLYRPQFDRWLRPPLFRAAQRLQNARRPDEHLGLAEEKLLDDEEQHTQRMIDEIAAFTRENWLPGAAQRFGNTKTFGVLRGELTVPDGLPAHLRHGLFARPGSYPAYVRFSGPGPYAPPDLEDLGQCSVGIKVMGVPGPKLMEDERETQDLILVSPASFVTPNIRENAKLQQWVRAKAPIGYAINPGDTPPPAPLHAAAVLADAQQPARGAVLQQRAVPARRGPGRGVLAEAAARRPDEDPGPSR